MNDMQGRGCKTNATNAAGNNTASMGKDNASPMGEAKAKGNGCNVKPSGGACGTGCKSGK